MFKIALMKFESNLAVNIDWGKRESFKKWDKIIVWRKDILMLMRLGCTLVKEKVISYQKNKDLFKVTKQDIQEANELFEKNVDSKTLENLEVFVQNIQFVEDCNEKYCTEYANDVLEILQNEKADSEKAKQDKKDKEAKEKQDKIDSEKAEAEKLEADKKTKRLEADKLGKAESEKKEAEKIEALKSDSEKTWDNQNGKAPDWEETQK